ncbi:MAG: DUF460 domain-containing protein [Candidatus Altiarchaeota archaeon]|nr:DUF460 domain-containing protein [Candidatus Altiarchaeota archaeon]
MNRPVIVGIDPGTTVGLAILDIDGRVLGIISSRNLSIDEVITKIASFGSAAIVACDKSEVPPLVNKVSSLLGARLFVPDADLSVVRKRELASFVKTQNDHERDALASAIYAYNHFQNKLRRIQKQVMESLEGVKARVIKGEKVSDISGTWGKQEEKPDLGLRSRIEALKKENRELRERLKSSQALSLDAIDLHYEKEFKRLRDILIKVREGRLIFLTPVKSLRFSDLKGVGIKRGDVLIPGSRAYDRVGVEYAERAGIKALITPILIDSLIPVISPDSIEVLDWRNFFFVDRKQLEEILENKRDMTPKKFRSIIDSYRSERK